VEFERHIEDGLEVRGDVLALDAVAARGARHEHAVIVRQAHRRAVDFHFQCVAGAGHLGDQPSIALLPRGERLGAEGVGERQHRDQVAVFLEGRRRLGANAPAGTVGGAELGVGAFELLQLLEDAVVLDVRHLGTVEDVVRVVGPLEDPPQLGGPRRRVRHRPLASS